MCALCRYGQVIAVVGMNPDKKYTVFPDERVELIQSMLNTNKNLTNVRAEGTEKFSLFFIDAIVVLESQFISFTLLAVSGYIWRFAKRKGASIFFRGIRSWETDGKDERSLQILNTWGPLMLGPTWPIPTIYLEGKPEYNHVSSTLIRSICRGGDCTTETLSSLVPAQVEKQVTVLYSRKDD